MEWCLGCHRDPGKNLRPRDQVFNMRYQQRKPMKEIAEAIVLSDDVRGNSQVQAT